MDNKRLNRLIIPIKNIPNGNLWISCFVLFVIHILTALYYKWHLGMDIEIDVPRNTWDFFWQTLSLHDLNDNLLKSLWYFHAQPPLFNIYGFIMHKIAGIAQLQAMQYFQIMLGGIMSAIIYFILLSIVKKRIFAFVLALVISLNPSMFLYEAFLLYSLPVAFLVILSLFFLAKYDKSKLLIYLVMFVVTLNVLILTRGLFNLIILIPFILFGAILANEKWKKFLLYACIISSISFGWYLKNYNEFGFFGASSWMGSNLWRNVSQNYSKNELKAFYKNDVIEEGAVCKKYFDSPTTYAEYGFDLHSEIKVLNADDYNNINMIAISQMYLESAKNLIRVDPMHYLNNCTEAYGRFCQPSFSTGFVTRNAALIPRHTQAWAWMQGRQLFHGEPKWLSSFYALLIPFCIIHFCVRLLFGIGADPRKFIAYVQQNSLPTAMIFYISYVSLVSSLFEYGENCRFKFSVESLILCYFFGVVCFPLASRLIIYGRSILETYKPTQI